MSDGEPTTPTTRSSRAEGKEKTRAALAAAALQLAIDEGFEAATVRDIAGVVGVSERTFFRHFPTKEAAVLSQQDRWIDILATALEAQPNDRPPIQAAIDAMTRLASVIDDDGRWLLDVARLADDSPGLRDQLNHGARRRINDAVLTWAERRLGAPSVVDPAAAVLAGTVATCAGAALTRWIAHNGSVALPDLVDDSFVSLAALLAESDS